MTEDEYTEEYRSHVEATARRIHEENRKKLKQLLKKRDEPNVQPEGQA